MTFPRALGFESQVADSAAPRGNDATNGPEIGAIGVLLIQASDDVGSDTDERAQGRCGLDAVLAAVPGRAKHLGRLLEVVDEEPLALLSERLALPTRPERVGGKKLLELLSQRRLCDPAAADTKQLDFSVQR